MITKYDLEAAIAECHSKRNPDASTCIKLAAFYTIKREMFGDEIVPTYSYAPANTVEINSKSDFALAVNGKEQQEVMPVIDELMETLKIVCPGLYGAVMGKLEG